MQEVPAQIIAACAIFCYVEDDAVFGYRTWLQVVLLNRDLSLSATTIHGVVFPVVEHIMKHVYPAVLTLFIREHHSVCTVGNQVLIEGGHEATSQNACRSICRILKVLMQQV